MRQHIKSIVELNDTPKSRVFAYFIQILILVSIISFSFETVPDLAPTTRTLLRVIEVFCVVVFTIEYILRIYSSDKKSRFIFSFYGIIDFLAILPFYLALGVDLGLYGRCAFYACFEFLNSCGTTGPWHIFPGQLIGQRKKFCCFFLLR